ncbi:MAG: GWxTD domain-containing protein, partial [bacterium]|nr:GWxTD domain-containing protein [bacterium]
FAKTKDPWKKWLSDVDIIMTRTERSVTKLLETEEERKRFMEMFWKARDPNPKTTQNEYQIEFRQRVLYARQYLKGIKSDRGRIYVLLGKPSGKSNFSGHKGLIECELWNYESNDKPGLLPFMNLVFFKPRNLGDFQLYYPGIHTPRDLLAPQDAARFRSRLKAFQEIKMNSAELAGASLSIIPGEGNPRSPTTITSSNFALNRIYTLPEREAQLGYIKNFTTPTGSVEVTHSTRAVRGFGYVATTRNKGLDFIHYALMPDIMNLVQTSKDLYTADIHLHISIEDKKGNIIYQHRRTIPFKATPVKRREIRERKIVFRDFAPIIEGEFNIILTFINNTTQEFFTHQQPVTIKGGSNTLSAISGYQLKEITQRHYLPFAVENVLLLTDPRSSFSQKDTIEGIVLSTQAPRVYMQSTRANAAKIPIETLTHRRNIYKFRKPLTGVKDATYQLIIKAGNTGKARDTQTISRKIHVLPFYMEITHPFVMERPEPETARTNYIFIRARQYLNSGKPDRAIDTFNRIPKTLWNNTSLPFIAKAYYMKGDYSRVVRLLEGDKVKKEYPVLLLLANSSIELKRYPRALRYLQRIRKYGDTVQINQLLAATYLSMGDNTNAKAYYERARKLKTPPVKFPGTKKINNE